MNVELRLYGYQQNRVVEELLGRRDMQLTERAGAYYSIEPIEWTFEGPLNTTRLVLHPRWSLVRIGGRIIRVSEILLPLNPVVVMAGDTLTLLYGLNDAVLRVEGDRAPYQIAVNVNPGSLSLPSPFKLPQNARRIAL